MFKRLVVGLAIVAASAVVVFAQTSTVPVAVPVVPVAEVPSTARNVLEWGMALLAIALAIAVPFIATPLVQALSRAAARVGIELTADRKAQLNGLIVNGINYAVAELRKRGKPIERNTVLGMVTAYAQEHGAGIAQGLGVSTNSVQFEQAVVARAERALNDPETPTPPEITPITANGVAPVTAAGARPARR